MTSLDKPLSPEEVEYLSFEGGGGKGNAFLGAIRALEDHMILRVENGLPAGIKGISGASAGAITAMLLGTGHSSLDIANILKADFEDFFDGPDPSMVFKPGTRMNFVPNKPALSRFLIEKEHLVNTLLHMIPVVPDWILRWLLKSFIMDDGQSLRDKIESSEWHANFLRTEPVYKVRLLNQIMANLGDFRDSVFMDFGIFNGMKIHYFFNHVVDMKMRPDPKKKLIDWSSSFQYTHDARVKWWTMKEVVDKFGIDLKFTAVNFRTGNVQILSRDTTPNLPIATAVRMSMSLPLIFKPVLIDRVFADQIVPPQDRADAGKIWEGLWVDGGYFDNAPIRVFPGESALLFRLGPRAEDNTLTNFGHYMSTYLKLGLFGSGAGQVTKTSYQYNKHIIQLDVTGTDLLKFNMTPAEQAELMRKNQKIVTDYFKEAKAGK
ncbi:patatin-like phospholipase family protein [Chitinophaga barathri]|uniref:PNPLA domain-containing protein n=1 Tax=Chitinophaga barathri TaxID=1647451 RepID=A0A3N4M9A1_9BACT|nr:patatin-like phospholipase family protein [Chitinophaga barathri]RPD38186.1 hypothetical protein EG028_26365 [Chitinophaga barathri]